MKTKWQKRPVDLLDFHWYWDGDLNKGPSFVDTINTDKLSLNEMLNNDKGRWLPISVPKPPSKQPAKPRPRNLQFDAIVQACGISEKDLPTQASHVAKVAVLLKEFPPEEILRRGAIYRAKYPGYDLTPGALQKNWANCSEGPKQSNPANQEKIKDLKKLIRESPAFSSGPYYTSLASEIEVTVFRRRCTELRNLVPNFNFNELRD